jgi:hypothetical protein
MNSCPEYKDALLLDIHGELDSESRSRWRLHLDACAACREERLRTMRLMGRLREVMNPPPLSWGDSEALAKAVRAQISGSPSKRSHAGWQWLARPWRVGPALATACLFAAIVSIWSFGAFDSFLSRERIGGKDPLQEMRPEDAEIIRNLDLLRQMDWVEKLVRTLDDPDEDPPSPEGTTNTQGMTTHEKRHHFG